MARLSAEYTRFLRRLRLAREKAGLTQAEAARRLGSTSLMFGYPHATRARALFERMGFHATMVEMRAELPES